MDYSDIVKNYVIYELFAELAKKDARVMFKLYKSLLEQLVSGGDAGPEYCECPPRNPNSWPPLCMPVQGLRHHFQSGGADNLGGYEPDAVAGSRCGR